MIMEDFKSMLLEELINLWLDLATPDFDLLKPSDQYYQKKLDLEHLIGNHISVGMSTQIHLACETGQKLNGVGMFLTKLSNFELKKWGKNYGAWEEDVD